MSGRTETVVGRYSIRMWPFFSKILQAVGVWILLWTIVFFLVRALSPDPVTILAGFYTDEATRNQLEAEFNLDMPVWRVYTETILRALTLDFGASWRSGLPVTEVLRRPAQVSGIMVGAAVAMVLTAATLSLFVSATRPSGRSRWLAPISMGLAGFPGFMVGLLIACSPIPTWLGLPHHGLETGTFGIMRSLVLPAAALTLPLIPYSAMRALACYEQISNTGWFLTARAFGASRFDATIRYGWMAIMPMLVDVAVHSVLIAATSSVAVEFVFGIPGIGTAMIDAIQLRDAPLILGIVGWVGLITIVATLLREWVCSYHVDYSQSS